MGGCGRRYRARNRRARCRPDLAAEGSACAENRNEGAARTELSPPAIRRSPTASPVGPPYDACVHARRSEPADGAPAILAARAPAVPPPRRNACIGGGPRLRAHGGDEP